MAGLIHDEYSSTFPDGVTVLWEIKGLPEQRSQNVFLRMNRFGFRSQPEFKHLKFYASNLVPRNENLSKYLIFIIIPTYLKLLLTISYLTLYFNVGLLIF